MTGRQATNRDHPLLNERGRLRPRARRTWARRGASVLALGALTLAVLTALQALGGPGIAPQPAFANGLGNCLPTTATKIEDPGNDEVLNASAGELVTVVSIKAGTECFITPESTIGTFTFDDCYVIDGLATAQVTVLRIGTGPGCKDISNIQFETAPAGRLNVCKVAGAGIAAGESFGFTVGQAAIDVPAGSCVTAGTFPAGLQVSVAETVAADVEVGSIACAARASCANADLAAGTVTVTIGAGENEVSYTNQRVAPNTLTLCNSVNFAWGFGVPFTFTVGDATFVLPAEGWPPGFCALVGTFPVGAQVPVTETIPDELPLEVVQADDGIEFISAFSFTGTTVSCEEPGIFVGPQGCDFAPSSEPPFEPVGVLLAGRSPRVIVTIGPGDNQVVFLNGIFD